MFTEECGDQNHNLIHQQGWNWKPGRRKALANHLVDFQWCCQDERKINCPPG